MNKGELIDKVAGDIGCTKRETKIAVECVFETITNCLAKGDAVRLVGFGIFGTRLRKARIARNPQKEGVTVHVPEKTVPFFKAGKELKEKVK